MTSVSVDCAPVHFTIFLISWADHPLSEFEVTAAGASACLPCSAGSYYGFTGARQYILV